VPSARQGGFPDAARTPAVTGIVPAAQRHAGVVALAQPQAAHYRAHLAPRLHRRATLPLTGSPTPVTKTRTPTRTTTQANDAPEIYCPKCLALLVYQHTILGGVSPPERWDRFLCPACDEHYELRHRTGRVRAVN